MSDGVWDLESDVVVVGGGAAGMAAALTAAHAGARVLLLERAPETGGTTAKSGGGIWILNNSLMRADGVEDPRPDALRYMARLAYPQLYNPDDTWLGLPRPTFELLEAFYDNGSDAVDLFVGLGAMQVERSMTPSYSADLDEDVVKFGRGLSPIGKPAKKSEGTGGDLLIAWMERAARDMGVSVLVDHRVTSVLRNDAGEVIGVEAHVGRRTVLVRAQRAVVFGSGGFLHDPDLRREFLRGPVFGGCAAETNTGDFVRIGIELGAQLGNMSNAWWNQVVIEWVLRTPSTIRDVWLPFGDSMIQVNKYGRRVVNEKMPYNERAQVHFHWNPAKREYSNLLLFMVYDESVANDPLDFSFRIPIPMPGESAGYVISGATWSELAENLDARLAEIAPHTGGFRLDESFKSNVEATVTRWNDMAARGVDEDHHRGETPIQVEWSQTTRGGGINPTMHAFSDHGPYHCIILGAGCLDTKGGPKINTRAQVLDVRDEPIPGLYGAGNCIASPAGQAYWSAGATIGPALTFGYIAGRHAAKEPVKKTELD